MHWTTKSPPTTDPSSPSQPSSTSPSSPKAERPSTDGGVNTTPMSMPAKLAEAWDAVKDGPKDPNTTRSRVPVLDAVGVSSALELFSYVG